MSLSKEDSMHHYICSVCGHDYGTELPTPLQIVVHRLIDHEGQQPIMAIEFETE